MLVPHLPYLVKVTLPEVELYTEMVITGTYRPVTGGVVNSPNLRFGSSVLSQRKEAIRREDEFDSVNLRDLFGREINIFLQRVGSTPS